MGRFTHSCGFPVTTRSLSREFDLSWTVKTHRSDRWEAAEQLKEMFRLTGAPRCKPLDRWADCLAILDASAAAWWRLLLIWHHGGRHVEQYENYMEMDWRLFHSSQSSWSWPDWIAVTVDGFDPWSSSPDSSFTQEPNNSTCRKEWWVRNGPGGNTERFLVTRQVGVGLHVTPQGRVSLQTNMYERGR